MQTSKELPGSARRYLAVAQSLLASIGSGEYAPGARLPAHTEVAAQAGVSRATAREAFLALEVIGAIEVRHGDGTFVRMPSVRSGAASQSLLDDQPRELIETRLMIEPLVAALAADHIGQERLGRLQRYTDEQASLVEESSQVARFVALGLAFHADLAPGCGNQLLADIAAQLVNVETHPLWTLVNQRVLPDPASRIQQVVEHRQVLDAISARDAAGARAHMRHHLGSLDRTIFDGRPGPHLAEVRS